MTPYSCNQEKLAEPGKCCEKCIYRRRGYDGIPDADLCNHESCPCHQPQAEGWEKEFDVLVHEFLVQQLAWEKSEHQDLLRGSPVLQEMAERKYDELRRYIRSLLSSSNKALLQRVREEVVPKEVPESSEGGEGFNFCRADTLTRLTRLEEEINKPI